MLGKTTKIVAKGIVALVSSTLALGAFGGVAAANDAPIETLLLSSGFSIEDAEDYAVTSADQTSAAKRLGQRHYVLSDGTRVMLSGSDTEDISQIERIRVSYPDDQTGYKTSVANLNDLLGLPISGRGDLLVWETQNNPATIGQSRDMKIIAGTHGTDKYVISINRQGLKRGNNRDTLKSKATPRNERRSIASKPLKKKRDAGAF